MSRSLTVRLSFVTAVLLVSALAVSVWLSPSTADASTSAAEAAMRNQISAILDDEARPGANWGIYVRNLSTGQVVYSRNANQSFVPASNQKVLSSALALEVFGPDHRFKTELHFDGQAEGTVLRGDLTIRGSGDPTFGSILYPGDPLARWARQLADLGFTGFQGRIVADARVMPNEPYNAGWDIDYIATSHWAPAASGLSYSDNLVFVEIAGTSAGNDAEVNVRPAGYVNVVGTVGTRSGRGFSPMRIDRTIGTNDIVIDGSVTARYRGTVRLPVHDPALFTVHAFAERLRGAGLDVQAEIIDASTLEDGPEYGDDPLFVHVSPPLIDILAIVNQRSNNLYAEQVFRAASASGTARGSAQRLVSMLQSADVSTRGLAVRDGSGLSRKNLITPETMGGLLAHQYSSDHRDAFVSTLARGGQPNSTLQFRLGGVPIWAKTGTIEHVRTLSGYVVGPGDTPYAFVLFANNFTVSPSAIGQVQNDIIEAIVRGGGAR